VLKITSNQEESTTVLKANQLKYKCLVTDGKTFCVAILAPQFNSAIQKEEIKTFSVLKLSHGHTVYVNGTKYFFVLMTKLTLIIHVYFIRFVVLAGLSVVKHFDHQICDLHIVSDGYNSKIVASMKRKLEMSQNSSSDAIVTPKKVSREDRNQLEQKGKVTPPPSLWNSSTANNDSSTDVALSEAELCLKGLHLRVTPIAALSIFSNR
jgi:hypothetical protein